jgi:hypothetical protein
MTKHKNAPGKKARAKINGPNMGELIRQENAMTREILLEEDRKILEVVRGIDASINIIARHLHRQGEEQDGSEIRDEPQ